MKRLFLTCFLILPLLLRAQRDYTRLVNPMIGTGGHGHTFPGASMPFGMMQLSPDTRMADWDGSSGYHYSDSVIYGFSHTHLSGTGIPDLCDLLFMPFSGKTKWEGTAYRSPFRHATEKASPGYYEVVLDRQGIRAQLTTALRSGMHQYTFPKGTREGALLIDLKHRDEVLESYIEQVSPNELRGMRRSRSWAQNQVLYFHIRLENPVSSMEVWDSSGARMNRRVSGRGVKAALRFPLNRDGSIRVRVGISAVSEAGAKANLEAEIRDWDFSALHARAKRTWNKELSRIDVRGGTRDEQTVFYTALYHTFLVPNIFQDADGSYRGTDGKVHVAKDFTNYSVFSLWDTYRAYHPLMTIIQQKRTTDWINTFLHQYQNGGMLPVWELHGNETFCMIGYHSAPVIADAYQKGIRGFDAKLALEALRDYAESDRYGLKPYRELGYIPNNLEHESVSKTLEYAYDDWCIAQMAQMLGDQDTYWKYFWRAQSYRNVFDPQSKHMRGKTDALWHSPYDPREINNFFTEGNAWHYSFAVPQDIEGLRELHGGYEGFSRRLNELFTTSSQTTGRDQADVTGLIGQYAHGNEPSHHMAYLFNDVFQPWRTQELVQQICRDFYRNSPDGLIGNEDCGQMSAWYVFSAMGFYPVCPGNGWYSLGLPVFDDITIRLENGHRVHIRTKGRKPGINYWKEVRLDRRAIDYSRKNGRSLPAPDLGFLFHDQLLRCDTLTFVIGNPVKVDLARLDREIAYQRGSRPAQPESYRNYVPVPFLQNETNKFRDSLRIELGCLDSSARLYYFPVELGQEMPRRYTAPIPVHFSARYGFFAETDSARSKTVYQDFYRLPSDRTITVESKVHPMYTAGGPDALIDSIRGTTNWRSGAWQSYYDQDLEAVIDLKQVRPLSYAGVHVLQDVSPWILYPREVIFYISNDGKNFTEAGRVINRRGPVMDGPQVQELGVPLNGSARFVKVRVINGGKLPAGHESAGNPSHLFIDEIMVR